MGGAAVARVGRQVLQGHDPCILQQDGQMEGRREGQQLLSEGWRSEAAAWSKLGFLFRFQTQNSNKDQICPLTSNNG